MPQKSFIEKTAAKLEFEMKTFEINARFMMQESEEEIRKALMTGASAYATSAQRHTPPSLGLQDIGEVYYNSVEMDHVLEKGQRTGGMRVWYNLRKAIKNPQTHRWKRMFGQWLREGYEYAVVIKSKAKQRKGRWMYIKPLHTRSLVQGYAIEDYRGLMRAAWGIGFMTLTNGKAPPVFTKYFQRRPALHRMTGMGFLYLSADGFTMTIENRAIPSESSFLSGLEISASLASVRSMNDHMTNFFKKQFNL